MKKYVNKFRSDKGFTLVELLAVLSMLAVVGGVIFSIIMFGINSYQKIQIENELRDEADLLMSTVMTELYSFAPETIQQITNGIEMEKHDDSGSVVINQIYINDDGELTINNDGTDSVIHIRSIIVEPDTDIVEPDTDIVEPYTEIVVTCSRTDIPKCRSGMIEINLVIAQDNNGNRQQLALESKFGF